jgi:hypothetical protein
MKKIHNLPFTMEKCELVSSGYLVVEKSGGLRPATETEAMLWELLLEYIES